MQPIIALLFRTHLPAVKLAQQGRPLQGCQLVLVRPVRGLAWASNPPAHALALTPTCGRATTPSRNACCPICGPPRSALHQDLWHLAHRHGRRGPPPSWAAGPSLSPKSLEIAAPKPLTGADAKAGGAVNDDRCSRAKPNAADHRTRPGPHQGLPAFRFALLVGGVGVRLFLRLVDLPAGTTGGAR